MTHDTSGWSWREFWLGLDRWLNTWFGGRSLETISSRAGRALPLHWWATALCWVLSWFDRDHCHKAAHGAVTPPPKPAPVTKDEGKAVRRRPVRAPSPRRRQPSRPQERPPEAP